MALYKRRNRNTYDIIASIIKASMRGAGRTQIMYHVNLSFKLRNEYLDALVHSGFLERRELGGHAAYFPTKDGADFLEHYSRIQTLYKKMLRHLPYERRR